MLKNNTESKHDQPELRPKDAMELQRRAKDDVRKDAESFASKGWQRKNQFAGSPELALVTELFCPKRRLPGINPPEGINGRLVHSVGNTTSNDLLDIFLAARAQVVSAQSMRIFRDNVAWAGKYVDWMKQVL